jgi:hypothetical protein
MTTFAENPLHESTVADPSAAIIRTYKQQIYECLRREPYVNRKGRTVEVMIWRSQCLACGATFTFKHQARGKFRPNRHCDEHKKKTGQRLTLLAPRIKP